MHASVGAGVWVEDTILKNLPGVCWSKKKLQYFPSSISITTTIEEWKGRNLLNNRQSISRSYRQTFSNWISSNQLSQIYLILPKGAPEEEEGRKCKTKNFRILKRGKSRRFYKRKFLSAVITCVAWFMGIRHYRRNHSLAMITWGGICHDFLQDILRSFNKGNGKLNFLLSFLFATFTCIYQWKNSRLTERIMEKIIIGNIVLLLLVSWSCICYALQEEIWSVENMMSRES